jgi:hypothetical protein
MMMMDSRNTTTTPGASPDYASQAAGMTQSFDLA